MIAHCHDQRAFHRDPTSSQGSQGANKRKPRKRRKLRIIRMARRDFKALMRRLGRKAPWSPLATQVLSILIHIDPTYQEETMWIRRNNKKHVKHQVISPFSTVHPLSKTSDVSLPPRDVIEPKILWAPQVSSFARSPFSKLTGI